MESGETEKIIFNIYIYIFGGKEGVQLQVCFPLPEGTTIRESGAAIATMTNPMPFYNETLAKSFRNLCAPQNSSLQGALGLRGCSRTAVGPRACCIPPSAPRNLSPRPSTCAPPYTFQPFLSVPISHIPPKANLPLAQTQPPPTISALQIPLLHS